MPAREAKRERRSAESARTRILEAAERKLIEGGPDAVRVQALARELGLTDAAIHHHFGSREGLLEALLRFGGKRLRAAVAEVVARDDDGELDVRALVDGLLPVLEGSGYSWLALWLFASGWRDQGSGLFDDVAAAIDRRRPRRRRTSGAAQPPPGGATAPTEEARFLAAWLALTLMAEPLFGLASRRSVSLAGDAATTKRFRRWIATTFERLLESA
jgi:AcrR family transcriptional regulator